MKILFAALGLLIFAGVSQADSLWTYTGHSSGNPEVLGAPPNLCGCSLSGSVTLDSLGNAIAWDFTDGTHELTKANSTGIIDPTTFFDPDAAPFTTWFVALQGEGVGWLTEFSGSGFEATDSMVNLDTQTLYGYVQGNGGSWLDQTSTPEPSTLLLLGAGLVGLLARQRRKSKRDHEPECVWEPLA